LAVWAVKAINNNVASKAEKAITKKNHDNKYLTLWAGIVSPLAKGFLFILFLDEPVK